MKQMLARWSRWCAQVLIGLAAGGLLATTAIVGWQVAGRYGLGSSPSWSEQASLTLMIWYVSLAAAAGVRDASHVRITAVEGLFGPHVRRRIRVFSNLIVAICGLAMFVWGSELVARTWTHLVPSLGIPRGSAYAGLPISGLLIALFALERIFVEDT